jgi:mono/diheme cytochrome c family protein
MKSLIRVILQTALILIANCAFAQAEAPIDRAPAKAAQRTNPYASDQRARTAGEKLFRRECADCHGENAAGLRKAPPLNLPVVTNAPPGAIFWVLRNGSIYDGMPSFAHLPEPQRWQIVTYLQSLGK